MVTYAVVVAVVFQSFRESFDGEISMAVNFDIAPVAHFDCVQADDDA